MEAQEGKSIIRRERAGSVPPLLTVDPRLAGSPRVKSAFVTFATIHDAHTNVRKIVFLISSLRQSLILLKQGTVGIVNPSKFLLCKDGDGLLTQGMVVYANVIDQAKPARGQVDTLSHTYE